MAVAKWIALVLVLLLQLSCASGSAGRGPDSTAQGADAGQQVQRGQPVAAPSLLGKNIVAARTGRSGWFWIMYPVNRALDLLDIVSFHAGLEGGFYVDAHATRALQVALGAGGGMQLGWWQKRELAIGVGHVAGLSLLPLSLEGEGFSRLGTRGVRSVSLSAVGLNAPLGSVYQQHRDYWGVGFRVIALLAGAEVEFHPVELADAAFGFVFLDFLQDDIGRTRSVGRTGP